MSLSSRWPSILNAPAQAAVPAPRAAHRAAVLGRCQRSWPPRIPFKRPKAPGRAGVEHRRHCLQVAGHSLVFLARQLRSPRDHHGLAALRPSPVLGEVVVVVGTVEGGEVARGDRSGDRTSGPAVLQPGRCFQRRPSNSDCRSPVVAAARIASRSTGPSASRSTVRSGIAAITASASGRVRNCRSGSASPSRRRRGRAARATGVAGRSRPFARSGRQDLNLRPPGPRPERSGCLRRDLAA